MSTEKILVIGAKGQIGSELVKTLSELYKPENVIASDVRQATQEEDDRGPFELIDVMHQDWIRTVVQANKITQIYHLAAILSANAEEYPIVAWKVNFNGLINVLEVAKNNNVKKVFWPSSIAVFGPNTPKVQTPQVTITDPDTIYGISKLAGEGWCYHNHKNKGMDIRSIRYPGLISHGAPPGGGTTDYAVEIFHNAVKDEDYTCPLSGDARLPMMYMDDAIRATIELMEAPEEQVKIRTSYNISGMDFTPAELTTEIQKHKPNFNTIYAPDFRDAIAASWPDSIDDSAARNDWNWAHHIGLEDMVKIMLEHV